MAEEMIDVLHIGPKEVKIDRPSGILWYGRESQPVPKNHANRILQFPTVFVRTDQATVEQNIQPPVQQEAPEEDDEPRGNNNYQPPPADSGEVSADANVNPEKNKADNLSIEDAISVLEPGNPEHFGGKGVPRLDAIKALSGDHVTVDDLRKAWDKVKNA